MHCTALLGSTNESLKKAWFCHLRMQFAANYNLIQTCSLMCRCFTMHLVPPSLSLCSPSSPLPYPQGCSLRNTEWVVGAVIFTGHESKASSHAVQCTDLLPATSAPFLPCYSTQSLSLAATEHMHCSSMSLCFVTSVLMGCNWADAVCVCVRGARVRVCVVTILWLAACQ